MAGGCLTASAKRRPQIAAQLYSIHKIFWKEPERCLAQLKAGGYVYLIREELDSDGESWMAVLYKNQFGYVKGEFVDQIPGWESDIVMNDICPTAVPPLNEEDLLRLEYPKGLPTEVPPTVTPFIVDTIPAEEPESEPEPELEMIPATGPEAIADTEPETIPDQETLPETDLAQIQTLLAEDDLIPKEDLNPKEEEPEAAAVTAEISCGVMARLK